MLNTRPRKSGFVLDLIPFGAPLVRAVVGEGQQTTTLVLINPLNKPKKSKNDNTQK